ncbi:MAG: DUF502 domain-containing protein [Phycisphaerales bacterium]|nr:MAG: DUF502 domain-containing protein [Phycisphaerales bacterium]
MTAGAKRKRHNTRLAGIRQRLLSGILLLVPLVVTVTVVLWLFGWIRRLLRPALATLFGAIEFLPGFHRLPAQTVRVIVSGMAILVLLLVLYVLGVIGSKVFGKRIITRFESLFRRIPLAGALYSASKQVVETFSSGDRPVYKSVVLVDYPYPGSKAVGFLTGHIKGNDGLEYAKVFVPTAPSPVTGFLVIQPLQNVIHTDVPVEEAFKMILSGGLISPERLPLTSTAIACQDKDTEQHAD